MLSFRQQIRLANISRAGRSEDAVWINVSKFIGCNVLHLITSD